MREFANWLKNTDLSDAIVTNLWVIPAIQSLHILAIGVLVSALLMIDMRILGYVAKDQTIAQITRRYSPWIWGAILTLLITGVLLVFGEPARELLSFSFWAKMTLLVFGIIIVLSFQTHLYKNAELWNGAMQARTSTKTWAIISIFVWVGIIILGRFIAWDAQIWGSLSPQA